MKLIVISRLTIEVLIEADVAEANIGVDIGVEVYIGAGVGIGDTEVGDTEAEAGEIR